MRKVWLLAGAALLAAAAAGCGKIKNEDSKRSFKESFVRSCVGDDKSERTAAICACAADGAIEQLTFAQLANTRFAVDHIKKNILPGCTQKADSGERT